MNWFVFVFLVFFVAIPWSVLCFLWRLKNRARAKFNRIDRNAEAALDGLS